MDYGLADKQNLEHFVESPRLEGLGFVDGHEYWERNCDLEMCMRTSLRLTKGLVGIMWWCWHFHVVIVGYGMYRCQTSWSAGNGLSLLMLSPLVFAYYSSLMMFGCKPDKVYIWRIEIKELLVSVLVSFVAAS